MVELDTADAHSIPPSVPPLDEPTLVLPRVAAKRGLGLIPATSERPVPVEPKVVIARMSAPSLPVAQSHVEPPPSLDDEDVPISSDSESLQAEHGQWTTSPSVPPSERQNQAPVRVELELIAAGKAVPIPSFIREPVLRYPLVPSTPPSARRVPPRASGFLFSILRAIGGACVVLGAAAGWRWYEQTRAAKLAPPPPLTIPAVTAPHAPPPMPSTVIATPSAVPSVRRAPSPAATSNARAGAVSEPGDDLKSDEAPGPSSTESSPTPHAIER